MNNIFLNNLRSLRQVNTITAIFTGVLIIFPLIFESNIIRAAFFLASALIALLLSLWAHYKIQTAFVSNKNIYYITTAVFYANLMLFTIYLSVWAYPDILAPVFYCFYISSLLLFVNPPIFNLYLTLGGMLCYIASITINMRGHYLFFGAVNVLSAAVLSLYFSWYICKLRLGMELSAVEIEKERNQYFDQSLIDELTQLKNRRDFMQTFHRYMNNYRSTDDWLCVSILDIDFFKLYNDKYGHPMGDDCLRGVGRVLNSLMDSMGVYTARVGGEEFAMLWFEQDLSHVNTVIYYLQELIKGLEIPHEKSKVSQYITVSIGIHIERCGGSDDLQTIYDLADKALYTAKESGRNCAIV
ncbi:MAG: GGDEF domain-containing protein, partial [Treponema sp.]|nr:GGDEF domain-containing protein [Treponema sp.]